MILRASEIQNIRRTKTELLSSTPSINGVNHQSPPINNRGFFVLIVNFIEL